MAKVSPGLAGQNSVLHEAGTAGEEDMLRASEEILRTILNGAVDDKAADLSPSLSLSAPPLHGR